MSCMLLGSTPCNCRSKEARFSCLKLFGRDACRQWDQCRLSGGVQAAGGSIGPGMPPSAAGAVSSDFGLF